MYDEIDAYVDGSYNKKLHLCSYGVILIHNGEQIGQCSGFVTDAGYCNMRNVGGEILSATEAMKYAYENDVKRLNIYYDYTGICEWASGGWQCNNEYTKKYKENYENYKKTIDIRFTKVKSHSGVKYNELVDQLAKESCFIGIQGKNLLGSDNSKKKKKNPKNGGRAK